MADLTPEQLSQIDKAIDPDLKRSTLAASQATECYMDSLSTKYADKLNGVNLNDVGSELMMYTDIMTAKEQDRMHELINKSNELFFAFSDEAGRIAGTLGLKDFNSQVIGSEILKDSNQCGPGAMNNNDTHIGHNYASLRGHSDTTVSAEAVTPRPNPAPKMTI